MSTGSYQPTLRLPALPAACKACRSLLPEHSHYCPSCGARIDTRHAPQSRASGPSATTDERVEAMLAEANLQRIRGKWAEAEARCIDIMRSDANNIHAYALLGDIYRDQNRYEEAAQWYQMALDMDPSSLPDKVKLKHVEEELARQLARAAGSAPSSGGSARPARSGTQKVAGLSPSAWLNGMWAACVVFVIAVVILIFTMRQHGRERAAPRDSTLAGQGTLAGATPSGASLPGSALNPSPLPAPTLLGHASTHGPSSASTTAAAPAAPQTVTGTGSDRENSLRDYVARQMAGFGLTVGAVTVDPRDPHATVVVVQTVSRSLSGDSLRDLVIRNAFSVAQASFAGDSALQRVTVNVRLASAAGSPEPFFAGDVDRGSAERFPETTNPSQLLGAFSGVWWVPSSDREQPGPPVNPGETDLSDGGE